MLEGTTILRFAHAFENGGGTETYIEDLDRALLNRQRLTIIRLHLTHNRAAVPSDEWIGRGRLIRIPLLVGNSKAFDPNTPHQRLRRWLLRALRNRLLYKPIVWSTVGQRWVSARSLPHRCGQASRAGEATAECLRQHHVDLMVLHSVGSRDADAAIAEARRAQVPICLINHYSNDRWLDISVRKHAMIADAVAGVNGRQVPSYIRDRFINVSDGVDTEYFQRCYARPMRHRPSFPTLLLPARVVREKGHLDIIRAATWLRDSGYPVNVALAGRADDAKFLTNLRKVIKRAQLTSAVHFYGQLASPDLRDLYAASTVVAFPTYHDEGLGRALLESQSMGTPVVAYGTGGVPEAIISGRSGYLVRTGDVREFTLRLLQLLRCPVLRAFIAEGGRNAVQAQFSLTAMAERHEKLYRETIRLYTSGLHAGTVGHG